MGNSSGGGAVLEGIHACVTSLDALALEDQNLEHSALTAAAGDIDVLQRRYELCLEGLELTARLEAQLAALKSRQAAQAVELQQVLTPPDASVQDRTYAEMSTVEEIAGILTVSSAAAGALVEQSRRICSLPLVMNALGAGVMSWQHAKIVADETEGLTPAGAAGLVAHFFDPDAPSPARGAPPGDLVPSRFRAKVRGWRERHHPESIEKRHAKGVADRRMEYTPDRDGMAWVALYLPGHTASAIWNRTTATARGLQSPDEPRTLTQLRPDIAASLLLGEGTLEGQTEGNTSNIGKVPTPRADVLVTVPVFALLGVTDEPAELDGFGPIPASMARTLVADGADSFYRVLVDPRDGAPLEIGRTRYRLTEAIKQWIRMRDRKCTFPGCSNHTPDNDIDHGTAWEHGGSTRISNLAQLCPKHHRLKHNSHWTPDAATPNESPGWTSPTGRHYKPERPTPEPTNWPPGILPGSSAALSACFHGEDACVEDLPIWGPDNDRYVDLKYLSADDPLWAEFFAAEPFALAP